VRCRDQQQTLQRCSVSLSDLSFRAARLQPGADRQWQSRFFSHGALARSDGRESTAGSHGCLSAHTPSPDLLCGRGTPVDCWPLLHRLACCRKGGGSIGGSSILVVRWRVGEKGCRIVVLCDQSQHYSIDCHIGADQAVGPAIAILQVVYSHYNCLILYAVSCCVLLCLAVYVSFVAQGSG